MSNLVPDGWDVKELRDLVDFSNGKGHEKHISEAGKYVVVNSKYISSDGSVFKQSNESFCPTSTDDILMVMSDVPNGKAIAKCFLVDVDNKYTVNQRIARFRSKGSDPLFLFYSINRNSYYLEFDDGLKQTNLRKDDVLDCPIKAPPLPEQQKIAKIISSVDEVIEKTQAQIDKLKSLKKGMMQELLTTGVGNGGKRHTEFKDSPVGRIPAEWDVKPIGDFVNSMIGGAPLRPNDFSDAGVRVIPKKAVQFGGELIFDKKTFCTTDFADKNKKNIVSNDYLITTLRDLVPTGPTIGVIGELLEDGELILAQGVYGLRTHDIENKYLVQLSNSDWYRKEMRKVFVGSTQVHIRNQEFLDVLIPIPPIKEQIIISKTLNSIDAKVRKLIVKCSSIEKIKKALMQDLLTGNVRVNGD